MTPNGDLSFIKVIAKCQRNWKKYLRFCKKNGSFLQKVAENFKTPKKSSAGAKGMTVEQVVRVALCNTNTIMSSDAIILSRKSKYYSYLSIGHCHVGIT